MNFKQLDKIKNKIQHFLRPYFPIFDRFYLFIYLMPLFSFYFGFKFDNCDFSHLTKFLNHIKNSVILILVLCTFVFFISYYIFNSWIYVSYTTNLIFALALFGSKFRFDKNIFFIFLDFISLKRSSLVLWLINYYLLQKLYE